MHDADYDIESKLVEMCAPLQKLLLHCETKIDDVDMPTVLSIYKTNPEYVNIIDELVTTMVTEFISALEMFGLNAAIVKMEIQTREMRDRIKALDADKLNEQVQYRKINQPSFHYHLYHCQNRGLWHAWLEAYRARIARDTAAAPVQQDTQAARAEVSQPALNCDLLLMTCLAYAAEQSSICAAQLPAAVGD